MPGGANCDWPSRAAMWNADRRMAAIAFALGVDQYLAVDAPSSLDRVPAEDDAIGDSLLCRDRGPVLDDLLVFLFGGLELRA